MNILQELFDKIVVGFAKQKAFGYDYKNQNCLYLTEDGRRCAVGLLIPEDHVIHKYMSFQEAINAINLPIDVTVRDKLSVLQGIHDNCAYKICSTIDSTDTAVVFWGRLNDFATKNDLSNAVLIDNEEHFKEWKTT